MLALACLFALSLVAPRGWQSADQQKQTDKESQPGFATLDSLPNTTATVIRPVSDEPPHEAKLPAPTTLPTIAVVTMPQPEEPGDSIAEQFRFDSQPAPHDANELRGADNTPHLATPLPPAVAPHEAPKPVAPTKPIQDSTTNNARFDLMPSPTAIASLTKRISDNLSGLSVFGMPSQQKQSAPVSAHPIVAPPIPAAPTANQIELKSPILVPAPTPPPAPAPIAKPAPPPPSAWPLPKRLLERLDTLAQRENCRDWADEVAGQIERLNRLGPADCEQAAAVLERLRRLDERAGALADPADQSGLTEIRQVQYALSRRLDIWDEVCASRQRTDVTEPRTDRAQLKFCLADIRDLSDKIGVGPGLTEMLMLDTLRNLAGLDGVVAAEQQQRVARDVLGRLVAAKEGAEHRVLFDAAPFADLERQLRHWVAAPLPADELLARLEKYELTGGGNDARRVAEIRNQLSLSDTAADQELARRLEMHYRNANIRFAPTRELLNRFLPEPQPSDDPVNERILDADVVGHSTTTAKLNVRMLPDPARWKLGLEVTGHVESQTHASVGPVTFINQGQAQILARKLIVVDADGIRVKPTVAEVDNNEKVAGIYTKYDSIPLLGSIVRKTAMTQRQQQESQVHRQGQDRVRSKTCTRLDESIEPRLVEAERKFHDQVLDPLVKLELDPTAVQMETTEERLILRGRIAGKDQLAANSARPEAPADCLASAQIHESAINNLVDRLDLAGRTFTLPELHRQINEKLGHADAQLPDDLPEGVEITFATSDPIRVHCNGGQLELVLQIAQIRQAKHHWHDFTVQAVYRPEVHGLTAALAREGTIQLGGQYQGRGSRKWPCVGSSARCSRGSES